MKADHAAFTSLTDAEFATVEPRAYCSVGATVVMSAGLACVPGPTRAAPAARGAAGLHGLARPPPPSY